MRRIAGLLLMLAALGACAPAVQSPLPVSPGFAGPRLEADHFVAHDGARLPLSVWRPRGEPSAVIVAVHGMNDNRRTWHMAGPWWAEQGVVTYAYDQRGFGGSPGRGVWAGEALLTEDLRTLVALVRARHRRATVAVVGESLGSAVAIAAFASDRPPDADRVVLLAPAVWGWSAQPLPNRAALWVAARQLGETAVEPPEFAVRDIYASNNFAELYRMGRDPGFLTRTRFDTLYGLVNMMEAGSRDLSRVRAPLAYLYGGRDQIIAHEPTKLALRNLPAHAREAFYPEGHHLLVRDHEAERVMADVLAFIRDPAAPWPSGAGPIPRD